MITFAPNGKYVLVANEGEPNNYNQPTSVDPEGSVSIIDMTVGAVNLTQADVRNATFNDAIPKTNASSIGKYGPNATLAQDLEPEYIAVSHDSKTAWVTLQENNAIEILDIEKGEFTRLVGSVSRIIRFPEMGSMRAIANSAARPEEGQTTSPTGRSSACISRTPSIPITSAGQLILSWGQ
jgi:DNA-binding beta-propeller fold protein YncE